MDLYIIDYFWRDGNFLKVGRIISADRGALFPEAQKLMGGALGSISEVRGPFENEAKAQARPSPFLGPV